MTAMQSPPGLLLRRLSDWMDSALPGLRQGALVAQPISGGFSNLTYRLTDGVSIWVLRRPPLGHILPSAHDMAREFRIISALAPTEVPVPTPVAFCGDEDITGARFYLMNYVDGQVVSEHDLPAMMTTEELRELYDQMVDALVLIHQVDPTQVGLGDLGRPQGFLRRQVNRWSAQWAASQTRSLPDLDLTVDLLLKGLPERSVATIVHGDFRIGNLIFSRAGDAVVAVVDWEMATLGDPLADLGLLVAYHRQATDDRIPSTDYLTGRYADAAGVDVSDIGWFVAFGIFKLAVISEGIHHRYLAGQTVGDGFHQIGATVPSLLASAVATLQRK